MEGGGGVFGRGAEMAGACGDVKETTYQIGRQPFLVFAFYSRLPF